MLMRVQLTPQNPRDEANPLFHVRSTSSPSREAWQLGLLRQGGTRGGVVPQWGGVGRAGSRRKWQRWASVARRRGWPRQGGWAASPGRNGEETRAAAAAGRSSEEVRATVPGCSRKTPVGDSTLIKKYFRNDIGRCTFNSGDRRIYNGTTYITPKRLVRSSILFEKLNVELFSYTQHYII